MLYNPQPIGELRFPECLELMRENQELINRIDGEAKERGELLHRFIYEPHADGKAVYQIIKVAPKNVTIRVCTELGDDWAIPYWGEETTIDREYAEQKVHGRDRLAKIFS